VDVCRRFGSLIVGPGTQGSQSLALGLILSPLRGSLIFGPGTQGSQSLALGLILSPLRGSIRVC